MGGWRFFVVAGLIVGAGERRRPSAGILAVRNLGCLAALLVGMWLWCRRRIGRIVLHDAWVGPSEGTWETAADWSTGELPTSASVGRIGSGKTVQVTSGSEHAGIVQGAGTLVIAGGSLEVSNTLEASDIASLEQASGTLTGAAAIDVSSSFSWTGREMSGSGSNGVGIWCDWDG